jgi:DNA helicase HerA-like ATPase
MRASEARKIGISMCLISKHPTDLGSEILSQMGIQIIGRRMEPKDLECVRNMVIEKAVQVPELRVGEFIVNGLNIRKPTKVIIRKLFSCRSGT